MAIYIALVCGLVLHISSNAVAQSRIVFGDANPPSIPVNIVKKGSSISTEDFFTTFVYEQSPVVFKAAILSYPAFRLWTDEYFIKLSGFSTTTPSLWKAGKRKVTQIQALVFHLRNLCLSTMSQINIWWSRCPHFLG